MRPLRPPVDWLTFRSNQRRRLEAVLHIEGWTEGRTACGWDAAKLSWIRFESIERCESWLAEVGVGQPVRCRNCRRGGNRPHRLEERRPAHEH